MPHNSTMLMLLVVLAAVCLPSITAQNETDVSITPSMTYAQYCQDKRQVLLSSSQSEIVCELAEGCLSNICTMGSGSRDILSGWKVDLCLQRYTIVFSGQPFVLRLDKDTNVGFGKMRLHNWTEVALPQNAQFVNVTFRMVTTSTLGGTADTQISLLAPAQRACSRAATANKIGLAIGIVLCVLGSIALIGLFTYWLCTRRAKANHIRLAKGAPEAQVEPTTDEGETVQQPAQQKSLRQKKHKGKQVLVSAEAPAPSV